MSMRACENALVVFTNGLQSEVMDMYMNGQMNIFLFFYIQWITNIVTFQRNKSSVKNLITLCYDDFQQDMEGTMIKVGRIPYFFLVSIQIR